MTIAEFLLSLIIILVVAKGFGQLAQRLGQPFVLGELLGGALIGGYGLGILHESHSIELLAKIGLIILLFEIGLETDLDSLVKLGPKALLVAIVGIVLPLGGGYLFCTQMGLSPIASLLIGGAFSATSIGISMRALAELGESKSIEGQIVLGAALIDDVLGLLLLAVISALMVQGSGAAEHHSLIAVIALTLTLPAIAIALGSVLAAPILNWVDKMSVRGAMVIASIVLALTFALIAEKIGTSPIIGAFTAGLILSKTHRADVIETQLKPIADFFTPIFFVTIGASLNIQLLNPFNPDNHNVLLIALAASLIAIVCKFASGLAAFGNGVRKAVVGMAMVPRGEVVLIFANMGLMEGVINREWFAVLILVIFITATTAPILLKLILKKSPHRLTQAEYSALLPGFESEERL